MEESNLSPPAALNLTLIQDLDEETVHELTLIDKSVLQNLKIKENLIQPINQMYQLIENKLHTEILDLSAKLKSKSEVSKTNYIKVKQKLLVKWINEITNQTSQKSLTDAECLDLITRSKNITKTFAASLKQIKEIAPEQSHLDLLTTFRDQAQDIFQRVEQFQNDVADHVLLQNKKINLQKENNDSDIQKLRQEMEQNYQKINQKEDLVITSQNFINKDQQKLMQASYEIQQSESHLSMLNHVKQCQIQSQYNEQYQLSQQQINQERQLYQVEAAQEQERQRQQQLHQSMAKLGQLKFNNETLVDYNRNEISQLKLQIQQSKQRALFAQLESQDMIMRQSSAINEEVNKISKNKQSIPILQQSISNFQNNINSYKQSIAKLTEENENKKEETLTKMKEILQMEADTKKFQKLQIPDSQKRLFSMVYLMFTQMRLKFFLLKTQFEMRMDVIQSLQEELMDHRITKQFTTEKENESEDIAAAQKVFKSVVQKKFLNGFCKQSKTLDEQYIDILERYSQECKEFYEFVKLSIEISIKKDDAKYQLEVESSLNTQSNKFSEGEKQIEEISSEIQSEGQQALKDLNESIKIHESNSSTLKTEILSHLLDSGKLPNCETQIDNNDSELLSELKEELKSLQINK